MDEHKKSSIRFFVCLRGRAAPVLALAVLSAAGCKKEVVDALAPSAGGGSSSSSYGASCSTQLVDTGQKGTVAGTIRGSYSDVKMIPGTSYPATAYLDQTNLSIKFSYWNGYAFTTEIVSGDSSAAFVRLGMSSTGKAYIAWTSGNAVKVAVRTAALTSTSVNRSTWSSGIVDNSGVAPRALEIAVNPLDQVMLSYVSDTATTGKAKFSYCDTGCASPTDFQAMGTNPYVENTAIVAAMTGTGAGWCKASSTQYYPMVSYSVTGNVKVAICKNPLAQCLNGNNWTNGVVIAAGNVISKLHLDPTITGDVPKVATYNGASLITYKMGTSACTGALAAFSASGALGAYGSQWISFLKDQTNQKFHIIANSGAANTIYMNSSTTDPVGAYNAIGTLDSAAVPAATAGGADIDTSTLGIYSSFGINAANYDLKLNRILDYTLASNAASQVFSKYTPDLTGMMQLGPTAGTQLRNVAAGSNGTGVGIAYVDFSPGTATTGRLKYTYRSGSSGSFSGYFVPGVTAPQFPSLAFDHLGRPWVGYFDASVNKFYLATNSSADGSGGWTIYEFPTAPTGAPAALPRANNTAVGMYYSGGVAHPVLVMIDNNVTSFGVRAATLNNTTRAWSVTSTIDALTATGAAHLSVASDPTYGVAIAFQDLTVTQVKYAYMTSINTWSATFALSGVNRGTGPAINIDSSGHPSVSYFDAANNTVYLSKCTGNLSTCLSGGWSTAAVDSLAGVSGISAATGQLLATAHYVDSSGYGVVAYPRGAGNDGNLIVANNSTGSYVPAIAAAGAGAGAAIAAPALNYGVSGWGMSMARTSSSEFVMAYQGPGNWLYATTCH